MGSDPFTGQFDDREREMFSRCVNAFLTGTFIVRAIESDAGMYRFVNANFDAFEEYFSVAGWSIRRDENLGVITWIGPPAARHSLNLEETLSLLVLRVLYEERRSEIALHGERTVRQLDFRDRYRVMTERTLSKTRLSEILRRFQAMKLIRVMGDESDPDTLIVLYPSISFALDGVSVDEAYERVTAIIKPEENGDGTGSETGTDELFASRDADSETEDE